MKLSYRGVNYEENVPTLEVTEGEILGKYRGTTWRCHTLQEMPVPHAPQSLKYRGVPYRTHSAGVVEVAVPTAAPTAKPFFAAANTHHPVVISEVAKVHHRNICKNIERRMLIAQAKGDQRLLAILEAEWNQVTCSLSAG